MNTIPKVPPLVKLNPLIFKSFIYSKLCQPTDTGICLFYGYWSTIPDLYIPSKEGYGVI